MKFIAKLLTFLAAASVNTEGTPLDASLAPIEAIAIITGGDGNVTGIVTFSQNVHHGSVLIQLFIEGLKPGKHGFHIHEKGDLSDKCLNTGSHYNPDKLDHGSPSSHVRHIGDLGNIIAKNDGIVSTSFNDSVITLAGPRSIIGRAVVVHLGEDDLGLGENDDSKKTGNAGGRAGCGVIGIK